MAANVVLAESSATVKARPVPNAVVRWIAKNRPDYSVPPIKYFFGDSFKEEDLAINLKSNRGWPPYCVGGDFNGDNKPDYALVLFRTDKKGGADYIVIVLHGSDRGFVEVATPPNSMGTRNYSIGPRLMILPRGKHHGVAWNPEIEVFFERDSISITDRFSQDYWVWTEGGYRDANIYANE